MTFLLIAGLALYGGGVIFAASWLDDVFEGGTTWIERIVFALLWPLVLAALWSTDLEQ